MSEHTKGPWRVHVNSVVEGCTRSIATLTEADHYANSGQPYTAVVGSDGEVVCDNAHYYPQGLDPKNANLIAAAPDLLAALVPFLEFADSEKDLEGEILSVDMIETARAAIAKAKGESA